jgi:hypothetical protein
MRYAVRCYLNNSVLPATRAHAEGWAPDQHSINRSLFGYVAGDRLVASEFVTFVQEDGELAACDRLFALLNADSRPNGATERSMSVGDVAWVKGHFSEEWYACQPIGWKRIHPPDPADLEDNTEVIPAVES